MTVKDREILKYFKTVKCVKCTFADGKTEMKSMYDAGNLAILGTSVSGLVDTDCAEINKMKIDGRFLSDKELNQPETDEDLFDMDLSDLDDLDKMLESMDEDPFWQDSTRQGRQHV